jgi:hypothetical protein
MKIYFAISLLVQLLLAFFSGDKNKVSYMLYLLGNLFDSDVFGVKRNRNSDSISHPKKSKPKTIGDKYSFFLER